MYIVRSKSFGTTVAFCTNKSDAEAYLNGYTADEDTYWIEDTNSKSKEIESITNDSDRNI